MGSWKKSTLGKRVNISNNWKDKVIFKCGTLLKSKRVKQTSPCSVIMQSEGENCWNFIVKFFIFTLNFAIQFTESHMVNVCYLPLKMYSMADKIFPIYFIYSERIHFINHIFHIIIPHSALMHGCSSFVPYDTMSPTFVAS